MIQTALIDDFEEYDYSVGKTFARREYQARIVDQAVTLLEKHYSCLVTMATGTGKTAVARGIIERCGVGENRRVLWIVGREELVNQAHNTLKSLGPRCEVEMQDWRATLGAEIVVASKDSLRHRLEKYPRDHFSMIVTDETHHGIAKTYRKIYDYFSAGTDRCWHLGLTATPDRTDKYSLGSELGGLFASATNPYTIFSGQSDGWLVPFRVFRIRLGGVDLSSVGTVAGDLNQGQLAEIMEAEKPLHGAANALIQYCEDRPTIVFASSVDHAERLSEILNRYHPDCARVVTGKTNKDIRRNLFRRFGKTYQFLCNYAVATEGVDLPDARCVAMLRPTKSRLVWVQAAGRGCRPHPDIDTIGGTAEDRLTWIAQSVKPDCLLLDFVGVAGKHKLVSPIDVLGGKEVPEDLRKEAEKILETTPITIEQAIDEARFKIEEIKRKAEESERKQRIADEARRAAIKGTADVQATEVPVSDLYLSTGDIDPSDNRPTPKQVQEAQRLKLRLPIGCTRKTASAIIGNEKNRRKLGLATAGQVNFLLKHWRRGNVYELTYQEASGLIEGIISKWNNKRQSA